MNKELEALEYLFPCYHCKEKDHKNCEEICVEYIKYKEIMSALERKEKLEKVWNIVKEKNPRLSLIKSMIKTNSVDFDNYNCAVFSYERLTETEFNLLKEMLEEK